MAGRVQIYQKNLELFADSTLDSPEIQRRARNIVDVARALAPRSDGSHSFTDGVRGVTRGGRLANSIKFGTTVSHGKRVLRFFSDAKNSRGQDYARFVIAGTQGHVIIGNPNLAFQWINANTFVIAPAVNHPGTAPNDFLLKALQQGFGR